MGTQDEDALASQRVQYYGWRKAPAYKPKPTTCEHWLVGVLIGFALVAGVSCAALVLGM